MRLAVFVAIAVLQVAVGASLLRLAAQLLFKANVRYRRAFGTFMVVFVLMSLGFWLPLAINAPTAAGTIATTRSSGGAHRNATGAGPGRQSNPRKNASSKRPTTPSNIVPKPSLKPSLLGLTFAFLLSSIVVGTALELGFLSAVAALGLTYALLFGISLVLAIPFYFF